MTGDAYTTVSCTFEFKFLRSPKMDPSGRTLGLGSVNLRFWSYPAPTLIIGANCAYKITSIGHT